MTGTFIVTSGNDNSSRGVVLLSFNQRRDYFYLVGSTRATATHYYDQPHRHVVGYFTHWFLDNPYANSYLRRKTELIKRMRNK